MTQNDLNPRQMSLFGWRRGVSRNKSWDFFVSKRLVGMPVIPSTNCFHMEEAALRHAHEHTEHRDHHDNVQDELPRLSRQQPLSVERLLLSLILQVSLATAKDFKRRSEALMSFVSWLHSRALRLTFTMVITPRALRQWNAETLWSCSMSGSVVDMASRLHRGGGSQKGCGKLIWIDLASKTAQNPARKVALGQRTSRNLCKIQADLLHRHHVHDMPLLDQGRTLPTRLTTSLKGFSKRRLPWAAEAEGHSSHHPGSKGYAAGLPTSDGL